MVSLQSLRTFSLLYLLTKCVSLARRRALELVFLHSQGKDTFSVSLATGEDTFHVFKLKTAE
jgi:hypothetical protein